MPHILFIFLLLKTCDCWSVGQHEYKIWPRREAKCNIALRLSRAHCDCPHREPAGGAAHGIDVSFKCVNRRPAEAHRFLIVRTKTKKGGKNSKIKRRRDPTPQNMAAHFDPSSDSYPR